MSETFAYRADIDGLRALAILSVVTYRVEVPAFAGGFFVILGYPVTSLLLVNQPDPVHHWPWTPRSR